MAHRGVNVPDVAEIFLRLGKLDPRFAQHVETAERNQKLKIKLGPMRGRLVARSSQRGPCWR